MTKPIPDGFTSLTPSLIVDDAEKAIAFYKKAFGATETCCMRCPDTGKVMHAELEIFGSKFMMCGEWADFGCFSPKHYKGTPVSLHLYVKDCAKVTQDAVKAGAKELRPIEEQFWGDRMGTIQDPFGHQWSVATHVKDLTPKQIEEAGKKWMEGFKNTKQPVAA